MHSSGLFRDQVVVDYRSKKMEEEKNESKKLYIFNGKDFNNWKFRMEVLLREHDVENFIVNSLEEHEEIVIDNLDDAAARRRKIKLKEVLAKKERKCFSLIVQRIGNDYLEFVKDKANPKAAWLSLCGAFERKGVSNRMFLRRELLSLKMNENEILENHLLKFDKVLRDLKAVGAKMEEEDIICQLLMSLPKIFEPVITALETLKAEELTMEFVKGRLLDCDIKRRTNNFNGNQSQDRKSNVINEVPLAMLGYSKKNITCFICGKKGHYQNNCPDKAKQCCSTCTNCRNKQHGANLAENQDNGYDYIL